MNEHMTPTEHEQERRDFAASMTKAYAITLCWDDRYVVAPVEAPDIETAIAAAYEWANDGGYDLQRTFDECSDTYVGHITECDDLADAEDRGPYSGNIMGLPIPFEHKSDGEKLADVQAATRAMLVALRTLTGRINDVTRSAGYGSGMFEPEMADARAAIAQADALGITTEG